jgi:hypothetical protein
MISSPLVIDNSLTNINGIGIVLSRKTQKQARHSPLAIGSEHEPGSWG